MAKFCPNCGKQAEDNQDVCLGCGNILPGGKKPQTNTNPDAKSKVVAGILAIFIGSLGVHNFYLGYTNKAVAQLLITLLTCGAGSIISGIWGLIEGIYILTGKINTDANGVPLSE